MQELEKILEEIEIRAIKDLEEENDRCSTTCKGCCSDVKERKCNCRDAIIVRAFKKLAKCMNDGRIPAKEKPAEDGFYVATMSGTLVDQEEPFVGLAEFEDGNWVDGDDVIAWRPLPEPYRAENKTEASDWRQDMLRKFDRRSRQ